MIIGLLDVKIYEKLVNRANWSVELQLQKVGQWGPPVWQWHFIGQRGNWWTEGNSTDSYQDYTLLELQVHGPIQPMRKPLY